MMGEDVARSQDCEEIGHLGADAAQTRLRGRSPRLFFEVGAVELPQRAQAAEVEQAFRLIDVSGLELELAREQLEHLRRHSGVDLEADHPRMAPSAAQLGLVGGGKGLSIAVDAGGAA